MTAWARKNLFRMVPIILISIGCSDVRLQKAIGEQANSQTKLPEGSFCSRPGDLSAGLLKVLFIVDMSLSNIGEFTQVGNGVVSFSAAKASDPNGIRFDKMRDFINSCGANNVDNKFKVIGFSGGAIRANPAMSGCQGGFVAKDVATGAVDSLKGLQGYNQAHIEESDFAPSMQTTTYQDGLDCAKNVVLDDLKQFPIEAKNSNYLVFFITDGKASDNCRENSADGEFRDRYGTCCPGGSIRQTGGTCCPPGVLATWIFTTVGSEYCCAVGDRRAENLRCEPDPNYQNALKDAVNPKYDSLIREMMLAGRTKAATIRLQPIYYGAQAEAAEALLLLDQFASAGDSNQTIQLGNVNQADFCKYANSPIKTQYQTSEFNVINLTARLKDGQLLADSDMDGLEDKADTDPINPRSNAAGILDGICFASGGGGVCERPNGCDDRRVNSLHLTECDLAALSLADGDGTDSDKDRIPDLVEILRGSLANVHDSFNNLDGDQLNNLEEVHVGRQVDSPDDGLDPSLLMKWSISRIGADDLCPANQQNYKININRVPSIMTKKYIDPFDRPGGALSLSHDENENVVFIYYISEPLNNSAVPSELYGTVVRVPYWSRGASKIHIDPKSFQKLGSLDGRPKW